MALFGVETWQAYWSRVRGSDAVYASGRIDYAGIVTPFGAARLLGFDPSLAYLVQASVTAAMVLVVGWTWRPGPNRNLRAATLLAATLLAVPLVLLYDRVAAAGGNRRRSRREHMLNGVSRRCCL